MHAGFLEDLGKAFPESRIAELRGQIPPLKEAVEKNPSDVQARLKLADTLRESGQPEAALKEYREALRLDPKVPDVYGSLAQMYWVQGQMNEGLREWEELLQANPNDADAHFFLAVLHSLNLEKAVEHYEAFLRAVPASGEEARRIAAACSTLGQRYSETGREKEALDRYEHGLRADPNNVLLWNNIAWLYATAKDPQIRNPQKALEYGQKAVQATPEEAPEAPSYLDTLAEAYYLHGQYNDAIEIEKKAIALRPGDKFLQEQLKKFEEAKRAKKQE